MKKLSLLLALILNGLFSFSQVIYVDLDATGTNDGSSWSNAYIDLQEAFDQSALNGTADEIWIAEGVYKPSLSSGFDLTADDIILGGFDGTETLVDQRNPATKITIISGDDDNSNSVGSTDFRGFGSFGNNIIIDGLTFQYCYRVDGGAINLSDAYDCVISRCIFKDNEASYGGAIYTEQTTTNKNNSIYDCVFENNSAYQGGAVFTTASGINYHTLIANSLFINNNASNHGVAIFSEGDATWEVGDCIILESTTGPLVIIDIDDGDSYVGIINGGNNEVFVDEHLIATYALFVDSLNGDYSLQNCSPAIDIPATTGLSPHNYADYRYTGFQSNPPHPFPDLDLANNTRIVGAEIDYGPFEHQQNLGYDLSLIVNSTELQASNSGGVTDYQWYNCDTDQIVMGEINQSFTPSVSGSYACIISEGCLPDTTVCESINIAPSSLQSNFNGNSHIYPNPTADILNIKTELSAYEIELTDLSGKVMFSGSNTKSIDMSALSKGVYMVGIKSENGLVTKKIIKK